MTVRKPIRGGSRFTRAEDLQALRTAQEIARNIFFWIDELAITVGDNFTTNCNCDISR